MNEPEWMTRNNRIDKRLRSISPGWEIVHGSGCHRLDFHCGETLTSSLKAHAARSATGIGEELNVLEAGTRETDKALGV